MGMSRYQENVNTELAYSEQHTLKGRKGTKVYAERRKNHLTNHFGYNGTVEYLLTEYDYLVFEIQGRLEDKELKALRYLNNHQWNGIVVKEQEGCTEIACHRPQVFSLGVLNKLDSWGYIHKTEKHVPNAGESGFSFYVNARGLQAFYNVGSALIYLFSVPIHLTKDWVKRTRN